MHFLLQLCLTVAVALCLLLRACGASGGSTTLWASKVSIKGVSGNTGTKRELKRARYATTAAAVRVEVSEKLTYYQTMVAGAVSRTCAQTLMHPANTYKTLLQLRGSSSRTLPRLTMERLLRGADAQFVMSLPHGALYFCVIEQAKVQISRVMPEQLNLLADFAASTVSTTICSIVSTP